MSDNAGNPSGQQGDVKTESHSALFGLEGKRPSHAAAGSGAGSGIIGTSGHTGAAKKRASFDAGGLPGAEATTTDQAEGGKAGGKLPEQ